MILRKLNIDFEDKRGTISDLAATRAIIVKRFNEGGQSIII